jgi:hypothetical protein
MEKPRTTTGQIHLCYTNYWAKRSNLGIISGIEDRRGFG